ncbi:MAG: Type 1 glutamine amidotransferase-like domain-containing protein [Solobacterium sp.]|nr:Type 1 glutamine amidotransferase-like domain-containing protein [Solobacterium sp.]
MTNILINISNFDEEWAYDSLRPYIHEDSRILILPLSYDEGWITDAHEWRQRYGKGRPEYEELVRPFRSFGIRDRQIRWINYYEDDHESAARKIRKADILFFTGGFPDWMMQRLYDLGIEDDVRAFEGTVMGTSAGALIQLDEFHLTEENGYEYQYQYGLGLLSGFDMEVHYETDLRHITAIMRSLEDMGKPVVAAPNRGGLLIDGDYLELLGDAFIFDVNDLDELYEAYDQLAYGW